MSHKPEHIERSGEPENKTDLDGKRERNSTDQAEQSRGKGHGPLKGTDTLATTEGAIIDREKGKRTTM